jgi:hypothetical protein
VPEGIGTENLVTLPAGSGRPGAAAIELLLPAIEEVASDGPSRDDVRAALRP